MPKTMKVPDEMIEVLERLKKNVNYLTWNAMKITNTDLFRILAKKVNEAGIIK